MKNYRSLIIIILCMSLMGCTSLGLNPTSTNSPTLTATILSTSTSIPTPTLIPLPTATSTAVEIGKNGLPIFPENSISRGDGLEIAFSQGILNRLGINSVTISEDKMIDIKTVLVGNWIYLASGSAYENIDPFSLDDLRNAFQKSSGFTVILEGQKIHIDSKTLVRFEFVLLCTEQNNLIDYYSKQPGATFRVLPPFTTPPIMFLHVTENSLNFIYSVDCLEIDYAKRHNIGIESKIAWMLDIAFASSPTPFNGLCYPGRQFSVCWNRNRTVIVFDIYARHLVNFWDSSDVINSTILGGCKWENRECVSGSDVWRFVITP